ncbi:hypothetical protein AB0L14_06545 [Streptomyces sp. NPDC052727]|uniref:hypothetical protein n=1 Tax=Streptomyces sp. NPDC052727 TaxID=3154854 RepID=UPI00342095DD
MSWYKFAVDYVDARWSQLGGNSRKNVAKTLTATTIALLRVKPTQFAPAAVRTALREWAFNPLPKGKESTAVTKTTNAVDKRSLLNPEQAAAILDWIRRRPRGGKRLHAFFATLYYCGPRPQEAVAMRWRT